MIEIEVSVVIAGDDAILDTVWEVLVDACERKGWSMNGGFKEITTIVQTDAKYIKEIRERKIAMDEA